MLVGGHPSHAHWCLKREAQRELEPSSDVRESLSGAGIVPLVIGKSTGKRSCSDSSNKDEMSRIMHLRPYKS